MYNPIGHCIEQDGSCTLSRANQLLYHTILPVGAHYTEGQYLLSLETGFSEQLHQINSIFHVDIFNFDVILCSKSLKFGFRPD